MDCHEFDGQVVRLQGIKDVADEFVRVRLTRIEGLDLNLFEFDFDLTLMMFFMNAEEKIYARYGGRDSQNADNRQSLPGLRYTMQSVLAMHRQKTKEFAPRTANESTVTSRRSGGRGCMHCHQVKERENTALTRAGKWDRDLVYRYPIPDNLGLLLEVDRGNIVKSTKEGSPAAKAGLRKGDLIRQLAGIPVHSFGDAQFALDRNRKNKALAVSWQRGDEISQAQIELPQDWYKDDFSWRRSVRRWIASPRLYGKDLTVQEKKDLGLSEKQLAYRPSTPLHSHVQKAGIREGDIVLGVNDVILETDVNGFYAHVARNVLADDRVNINVLRAGKRLKIPMILLR